VPGETILDGLIILGVLLVVVFPIASIVALAFSSGARRQVRELEARLAAV
jgi:hypothetical protein